MESGGSTGVAVQRTQNTKPAQQAQVGKGSDFKDEKVGIEMVFVQGGTFRMGCTEEQSDCQDNEKPVHNVTLSDFYIMKYEITQEQWVQVMGKNPSNFKGDNLPIENVSWNDIRDFISELNIMTGKKYRLPTEAEWEYAARGGNKSKGYKYSGSSALDKVAWHKDNSGGKTQPIGAKQPNELGIHDMTGNVWEWVSDWYGANYYSSSSGSNPTGPVSGSYRVGRGGGWNPDARDCRVSIRNYADPGYRNYDLGFRLAVSP
jgi:formylglycine-generating enzyme required for sulfatase activity